MRAFRVALSLAVLIVGACIADRSVAPRLPVRDDEGEGRWRMVSAGTNHSCGLDIEGRAYCWGSNEFFQLGVAHTDATCGTSRTYDCSLVPIAVNTGRHFTSISAAATHTCAVTVDSVAFCWGNKRDGQAGAVTSASPDLQVATTTPMVVVSAGSTHTCGIRADSLVACWGSNIHGAVGVGAPSTVAPTVVSNQRFSDVAATDQKTCARTVQRQVMCWGVLWVRTSGDTHYTRIRTTPGVVAEVGRMAGIGVGPNSTCGFDRTGFGWCWDSNLHGESGAGPGPGSVAPRRIYSDEAFQQISVGAAHACGITSAGVAYCWGSNSSGQLGTASAERCARSASACSSYPMPVFGSQRFTSISAGLGGQTCGVTDHRNLYCWGAGASGQRGDGTRTSRSGIPRLAVVVYRQ